MAAVVINFINDVTRNGSIVLKTSFGAKPPNLMTANIFSYMVVLNAVGISEKQTLLVLETDHECLQIITLSATPTND